MSRTFFHALLVTMMLSSCGGGSNPAPDNRPADSTAKAAYAPGTFGYDLDFLSRHDSVVVLQAVGSAARVIVSPKYQAKVFTSTASGSDGISFGWVNYKAFDGPLNPHMNGYGGENRFWLGPEGGRYSLFFPPGAKMVFDNWKTPAPFDSEPWTVTGRDPGSVTMEKKMEVKNYVGTTLSLKVDRKISLLGKDSLALALGMQPADSVQAVAYRTDNELTNTGTSAWTEKTGAPCIWILDMMKPGDKAVTVIPYVDGPDFSKIATTNYFGEIPADRLKHKNGVLYLKADGKSRGKLGVNPAHAKTVAANYDDEKKVLTITMFDVDAKGRYLNQEWNTDKPVFQGDAVNAYNDGPLADGTQMGPFYEMESVSPAAMLKPGESLAHRHTVFHFTGPENALDAIAKKLLGVSLNDIKTVFP